MSFVTAWVLAGASTIALHFYGGNYLFSAVLTAGADHLGVAAGRHGLWRHLAARSDAGTV